LRALAGRATHVPSPPGLVLVSDSRDPGADLAETGATYPLGVDVTLGPHGFVWLRGWSGVAGSVLSDPARGAATSIATPFPSDRVKAPCQTPPAASVSLWQCGGANKCVRPGAVAAELLC
jgi:hypothetical protein